MEYTLQQNNPYQEWYLLFRESICNSGALPIALDWLEDRDLNVAVFRHYLAQMEHVDSGAIELAEVDFLQQYAWTEEAKIVKEFLPSLGYITQRRPLGPFHTELRCKKDGPLPPDNLCHIVEYDTANNWTNFPQTRVLMLNYPSKEYILNLRAPMLRTLYTRNVSDIANAFQNNPNLKYPCLLKNRADNVKSISRVV